MNWRIEEYYENENIKIKSELHDAEYVCTLIDIWLSKKWNFLGMTAHWIKKKNDLRRMSVALTCKQLRGIHNYDRLSEAIQEINADFNLDTNKIVASITMVQFY